MRLGYLLSQYPAISHTFLLHEVQGLRARGLHIETASINPPDRPLAQLPPNEAEEAATTRYIKTATAATALLAILDTLFTHPGVLVRGIKAVFRIPSLTFRLRLRWFFYLVEAILVGRWMRQRKLTHLHVHFGGAVASVGMLASIAWRIPYSLTIHGPEELLNAETYQLRHKLRQASFVICVSDFCRSQLCQLTAADTWSRYVVVRLGVDPILLTPADKPAHTPPLQLVCTGRLVPAKGHRILLQALHLLQQRNVMVHATLVGRGPERQLLEAYVKHHRLETSVEFTSALSHAETLERVRHADVLALASFAEGVPVALMEAMALGIPCVSTTISGIPELIRDQQDGLLVAPSNVEALAGAIEALALDPGLRQQLAAAARRRIITDYNLPLNHERLAHLFNQRASAAERRL